MALRFFMTTYRLGLMGLLMLALPGIPAAQGIDYPGVASLPGNNGTNWRSEAILFNPGTRYITVDLSVVPREGTTATAEVQYGLDPEETFHIEDVYDTLGAAEGAGILRVSGEAPAWVRTFNMGGDGSFGQGIPAVVTATGLSGQAVFFPLYSADDITREPRSNLILENLEERPVTIVVRAGSHEESRILNGRTMVQINRVGSRLDLDPGPAVVSVTGDGRWAGYVAMVDPRSGDPTTFGGRHSPDDRTRLFTGVAKVAGANDTMWYSELFLYNPAPVPVQVSLELIPRGSTDTIVRRGVQLSPGETVFWPDLYEALMAPDGAGTLMVEGVVMSWVRTYNLLPDGATFGQAIPPADGETSTGPGRELLFPISNPEDATTGFRSNLVLQNLETGSAFCTLSAGAATASLTVPASTYLQVNRVAESLMPAPPRGDLTLSISCDRAVSAFVTTIDPFTGDPTTVTGLFRDELSMAPPRIVSQPAGATLPAGSCRELSVEVEGEGPMIFQWYAGNSGNRSRPVGEGDATSIVVGPLQSTSYYWVEVENPGGVVASDTAVLTVAADLTAVPVFDPPPGTFSVPVEIHLSSATPGARIHYTTDGTSPTMSSPVYEGETLLAANHVSGNNDPDPDDAFAPLTDISLQVRAFAETDGMDPSPVVDGEYVIDLVDTAFYVPYNSPPEAGGSKHTLDIYHPHGKTGSPVLFFVYGGAWKQGDKNIYVELGNTFAGYYGFTTVVINYEISADPWNAVFPEHIEDVADAFAWTRAHIAEYGGDPQQIWLFGQSAGGHLVSLLATDGSYLNARGLSTSMIRGVISMSGTYDLYDMVRFPLNPLALDPDEILEYKALMTLVFGSYDQAVLDPYSPSRHTSAGQPPFRIIWAWDDMPGFPEEGQRFFDQVSAMDGPAVDHFLLLESDIPGPVLDLGLGGHYEEIYAVNTRDWNSVSTRAVASFIDSTVSFPEIGR